MDLPTFEDVERAAERLAGQTHETPLLRSDVIDLMTGKTVWFKPECNQKVRAFKYRGAYNRLSAMSEQDRQRGVVAFSSGNHAQGISRAAKELGMSAKIVMPSDAPKVKVAGVERDGAEIIYYDRQTGSREEIAAQIARDEGRTIVPSYDDPYIMAGQGTVGLEIAQEAKHLGVTLDAVITCIGGGGLCAGITLAMNRLSPKTKIFGAEPDHYNDHQMSIRAGKRIGLCATPPTLCDAIMTPIPGELTFEINKHSVTDVFTVSDMDCLMTMAIAKQELGVTLEPGGSVAMAAVLKGCFDGRPDIETIAVVLSGGNVDPDVMERAEGCLFGLNWQFKD